MSSQCVCRLCGARLTQTFVDLGMSPLCESYVSADQLDQLEIFYPLHVRQCSSCLLVQLPAYVSGEEIFSDYAYFSSYSDSWVAHAKRFADSMVDRLGLTADSLVTEVASNDGYLLQHFVAQGIPVLGIEPAKNVAEAAQSLGITTVVQFLGSATGSDIAERPWARRSGRREQRVRPRPRHPGLRGRSAGTREGHGPGHPGVPPPASPDAAASIRHDLSRALLVPLPPHRHPSTGHGGVACGRRRRARHPRWITTHLRASGGAPG